MKTIIRRMLVAATLAASAACAQDFSKIEVQATKITDSVYMLTGAGGNLGVSVGADSVFVIDDQYAPMTDKISAAIAKITPKPVRFVLNTHWHGDHTGGNENFAKLGAVIMSQPNLRARLMKPAPGANGQPPRPPSEPSRIRAPASRAADALAMPMPLVSCRCTQTGLAPDNFTNSAQRAASRLM